MEAKEIDTTVERARARLENANWDESKHPRGAGGRFGKGAGGYGDKAVSAARKVVEEALASGDPEKLKELQASDNPIVKKMLAEAQEEVENQSKKEHWVDSIKRAREALAKRNAAKKPEANPKSAEKHDSTADSPRPSYWQTFDRINRKLRGGESLSDGEKAFHPSFNPNSSEVYYGMSKFRPLGRGDRPDEFGEIFVEDGDGITKKVPAYLLRNRAPSMDR